jgi:hypothetical protein
VSLGLIREIESTGTRWLHIDVFYEFFDRFFSADLHISPDQNRLLTFEVNRRLSISVYLDGPMYVSLIHVDGQPILKESMIENVSEYVKSTRENLNLIAFLLEFSHVSDAF